MKKFILGNILMFFVILGILLAANLRTSQAQAENKFVSFSGVFPFFTSGGYLGFFDQKEGVVYIYDDQLKSCKYKYKLEKLGEPGIDIFEEADKVIDASKVGQVYGEVYTMGGVDSKGYTVKSNVPVESIENREESSGESLEEGVEELKEESQEGSQEGSETSY